jgi:methionine--tRNA ligase beta chain
VSAVAVENSEKLWLCHVDVGDEKPRQVVAGLQQYIPQAEMQGRMVVTVCNLKPAKLAGQLSEAMILAASCEGPNGRIVRTLVPADGSKPGERVRINRHLQPCCTAIVKPSCGCITGIHNACLPPLSLGVI